MAIKFNCPTTPSPTPIPIPAPIPTSTIAIPSFLSHILLADRISSSPLVLLGSTITSFIMSVDIPIYAHHLCMDSPPQRNFVT